MLRNELELYLNDLLQVSRFRDYCPNGLQVQGREVVKRIVTGVTASRALLEAALDEQADAVIVHHGYFWKSEETRIVGQKYARLRLLLNHDLNLFAFHLPLDSHEEFGNNAQLAKRLGLRATGRFGESEIGWYGELPEASNAQAFADHVAKVLGRVPLLLGDPQRRVRRIAWCTGGAQGYFDAAIALGADLYLSGEASEPTVHLTRESGVCYLAAGHHATERFGAQALGEHLAKRFRLAHRFIDIDNPV